MKNYLKYYFCILAFSCHVAFSFEHLIFIGNPGVGKSTIINSLLGTNDAPSGVSPESITKFFNTYPSNGKLYIDTPGLADMKMRAQAAQEIENALKNNGIYRLFFVITLESGRVRPEDITTINLVMSAINNPNKKFNVIINKVLRGEKKEILNNPGFLASIYEQINSGDNKTDKIYYIDRDRDMDDGEKSLIDINEDLISFIFEESSFTFIAEEEISKIEIDEFESIKAKYDRDLEILRQEIEAKYKEISGLQKEIKDSNDRHNILFNQMKALQESINNYSQNNGGHKRRCIIT